MRDPRRKIYQRFIIKQRDRKALDQANWGSDPEEYDEVVQRRKEDEARLLMIQYELDDFFDWLREETLRDLIL